MKLYERAVELKEETIAHRRFFHQNAEVGLDMPLARTYVTETLKEYGLSPKPCGYGITATVGNGGSCILLRADMDALAMPEESGEPFACPSKKAAHTCGHDFHAAMLLTAAKLLKEHENELDGTVKLMFQPAEESFEGSRNMIENGILSDPPVDAALAYHVAAGKMPVGVYMYNAVSTMMYSVNGFCFTIHGKGAHGAYPEQAIDPINAAVHIYTALQSVLANRTDKKKSTVFTIGKIQAGTAGNIIPDTAVMEGTLRCNDETERKKIIAELYEAAKCTAKAFGATIEIEEVSNVPSLCCDAALTREVVSFMNELEIPKLMPYPDMTASASEDFAFIAEKVPSCFMYLSAGFSDERGEYPAHNPKVRFHEDVCPIGAACYAQCAIQWLKNHKK